MNNKGLVIVYTGNGKGKTTAALGLALRAAGHKKKTLIVQFGKQRFSGEVEAVKGLNPYIKIIQGGQGFVGILGDKLALKDHKEAAKAAFNTIYKEVTLGKWDVAIADEIVGAAAAKLLALPQVLKLIRDKPAELDLVLTGRHAHPKIIARADLVTEVVEIKHPFAKGILAKKGIDY